MTGIKKETLERDKRIYDTYMSGISVTIIAQSLNTSRGHIYNVIQRYKDPVLFREREARYEANRKNPYQKKGR